MDISVSMEEVPRHKPDISRRALMKSELLVGRSVLSTMTTTLTTYVRARVHNPVSMLMYFAGQGTPLMDIMT